MELSESHRQKKIKIASKYLHCVGDVVMHIDTKIKGIISKAKVTANYRDECPEAGCSYSITWFNDCGRLHNAWFSNREIEVLSKTWENFKNQK